MDTKIDHALLICREKLKIQVKNLKAQAKTSKLKTTIKIKSLSKKLKTRAKNQGIGKYISANLFGRVGENRSKLEVWLKHLILMCLPFLRKQEFFCGPLAH